MDLQERIGAWLTTQGCFFRVWAPNATEVSVLVQGGARWELAHTVLEQALFKEMVGGNATSYWSSTVPGIQAGQLYRFKIRLSNGQTVERLDPAARDVLSSELTRHDPSCHNASVIVGNDLFPWTPFTTPTFENFIIYQLHVGSFAGWGDQLAKGWATFRDIEGKLSYIQALGFNCIQLLPVQEFAMDRSWGYNPASFFALESSYGSPDDLKRLVDAAHRCGLAVIFDVVYNHAGDDNALWEFDGAVPGPGGAYFEGGRDTWWGIGPAWWKQEVRDFFYQNARLYFEQYHADGLRFDVTTQIDGNHLKMVIEQLRRDFPDKYLIAEHLPDHPWIIREGRFCATWTANVHHECQRALNGQDPLNRIKRILGWDGYDQAWNLVKYTLGSHDDIGDQENGDAEHGTLNGDRRHRYFVDQLGGRDNTTARAKCRLAWALNIAMPGTPMLFMGSECLLASPHVSWGYWHDGLDLRGDHRFNWQIAGDPIGMEMRRLVQAANAVRWQNPALRCNSLHICHEDHENQVLGFVRELYDNLLLIIVNLGERHFADHGYGVHTGGYQGQWSQILCTQDATFGGWNFAGNAYHEPRTQTDGHIYINLPPWSVIIFRRIK